jgi:hypothetical protein
MLPLNLTEEGYSIHRKQKLMHFRFELAFIALNEVQ